ncbi:MAG: malate synthase G [Acidimicrobiia bacterium]|nr:malate synthase G [Acidimicrobiia bacterium]MYB09677.1 malate synthase G [Acidimicrobiia bacterium]MYB75135.1 malate synthase G [Acidimicrobiia bacterium]MYG58680.1 malate synthase G [Acidimicrobiia bacterium]MYI00249.1 malate synthase G [Acidimicrobiia bacterium]
MTYETHGMLEVASPLDDFVRNQLAPGTNVGVGDFWSSLEQIVERFMPRVRASLDERDDLQAQIDSWHLDRGSEPEEATDFLRSIGYLVEDPGPVPVTTSGVDPEIASLAGPQLVVPLDNARYALNAANARWGSLYDAFYGTDVIDEAEGAGRSGPYNPVRGQRVIARVRALLDDHVPLSSGSHVDAVAYTVTANGLRVELTDGTSAELLVPEQFAGYTGVTSAPETVLLRKHGLHIELVIDRDHAIGRDDPAGVADVMMESALTAIMDLEDSVAAVDAEDKTLAYANWLGLMQGTLIASFTKGGQAMTRSLNADSTVIDRLGSPISVRRRSVMLIRSVGLHMETDMVCLNGQPIPETIVDVAVAAWGALHNLTGTDSHRNSQTGSVYIVMPKLHGPRETALIRELFTEVEGILGLSPNTLKMGIMDEERRTSLNLAACIAEASERVVFINTGFLDRTGDDIHTNMEAGAMVPKAEIKASGWLNAYEEANVAVGLAMGLPGHAQIGKGMWARPDDMAAMLDEKIGHPQAGATTAWVPSPTAATLHALHYLETDVAARQTEIAISPPDRAEAVQAMLAPAVLPSDRELSPAEIQRDLDNNAQGILGYVTRWVGQGVGCSKVPDIDNVALMEDRATLRISSQHIANWLHHGLLSEEQVVETMKRMASVVDSQNADDPAYEYMSSDLATSIPFSAALALVLEGRDQPNGYTEPILTAHRRRQKAAG